VQVFSAREALNALIGREVYSIDPLGDNLPIVNPSPASKQDWVNLAISNNYRLKAAKLRRERIKKCCKRSCCRSFA
jgi:outer membrane protein